MSTGHKGPLPIFKAVTWAPFLKNLHVPFRFISLFIFTAAILGGYFLSFIGRRGARMRQLAAAVSIFLVIDFVLIARPVFKEAFLVAERGRDKRAAVLELPDDARLWNRDLDGLKLAEASSLDIPPIQHIRLNWLKKNPHFRRDAYWLIQPETLNAYLNLQQSKGTLDFYDPQHLEPKVLSPGDCDYRGEAFVSPPISPFASDGGEAHISSFTPNKILIEYRSSVLAYVVLNQNYFPGWRVKGDVGGKVRSYKGLISCRSQAGQKLEATFYYLPLSFIIGLIVTALSIGTSAYIGFLHNWRKV